MSSIDRLSMRDRPAGTPVMHQTWRSLLFLHWRVDENALRPLVPSGLNIDTHGGSAWISVTPFTITGMRPAYLPALPKLSEAHEVNVRTYVTNGDTPGIWFFSLDASSPLVVTGARLTYHLPYFNASMSLQEADDRIHFTSQRTDGDAPGPELTTVWRREAPIPPPSSDSLTFFLTERYALFARQGNDLYRALIHHRPWPLHDAVVELLSTTMLSAQGLPGTGGPELIHAQGEPFDVEIWAPQRVGTAGIPLSHR